MLPTSGKGIFLMRRNKISTITLGELDRAMEAFLKSQKEHPGNPAKAVFAALKSFEKDRGLLDPKGAR